MKIARVTEDNFCLALEVYSASWKASHADICTADFLERRDYAYYLRKKMDGLFLVTDDIPVGIFYARNRAFGDLYVLPERQGQGYGTKALRFAQRIEKQLTLTVLSTNEQAIRLYARMGFQFTGCQIPLRDGLLELEMEYRETEYG